MAARAGLRGFTILELAVVILVLGVVVIITAPAIPRPRRGADAVAHELAGLLQRVRRNAAWEGAVRSLAVDPASERYRVYAPTADGADSVVAEGAFPVPDSVTLSGPAGDTLSRLRFNALGRAEGGPIEVRDADGRSRAVLLDPFTGRIHVETD